MRREITGIIAAVGVLLFSITARVEAGGYSMPNVDADTGAYLMPDPDPASEHYWEQQAAAINFRFKVSLTPNCVIESFILEPALESKTLIACVLIPSNELDSVFSDPEYDPECRDFDFQYIPPGLMRDWKLEEQDIAYYYSWADDTGSTSRWHEIVILKENAGMFKVYFWSPLHTILNSIEDLEEWF